MRKVLIIVLFFIVVAGVFYFAFKEDKNPQQLKVSQQTNQTQINAFDKIESAIKEKLNKEGNQREKTTNVLDNIESAIKRKLGK